MAKAIAEKKDHLPVNAALYEEDAHAGFEGADADSYALPFLSILQALSPQCTRGKPEYDPDARPGELFESVSGERFASVKVIPLHYKRSFIEWITRDDGGGFVMEHNVAEGKALIAESYRDDSNRDILNSNGHQLVDTRTHYVLILREDGSTTPAVINMSATQTKKSKRWMSRMQGIQMKRANGSFFTPPMFSHIYELSSVPESNDRGSWDGWKIEMVGPVEDPELYNMAKAMREAVTSGTVSEDYSKAPDSGISDDDFEGGF